MQGFQFWQLAEPDALGDEPAGVLAYRKTVDAVGRGEAAVQGAGALGGLGGVLGDVGRDVVVGQLAVGCDRPGVVLGALGQGPSGQAAGGRNADADSAGGLGDGSGQ
jgi:hypothetical protein